MTSQELFTCDFPVYTVHSLSDGEFYVAGGGGEARTGVPNALVSSDLHADADRMYAYIPYRSTD